MFYAYPFGGEYNSPLTTAKWWNCLYPLSSHEMPEMLCNVNVKKRPEGDVSTAKVLLCWIQFTNDLYNNSTAIFKQILISVIWFYMAMDDGCNNVYKIFTGFLKMLSGYHNFRTKSHTGSLLLRKQFVEDWIGWPDVRKLKEFVSDSLLGICKNYIIFFIATVLVLGFFIL